MIEVDGKTYNEGFLNRLTCKVCHEKVHPDLGTFFYRVTFTDKVDGIRNIPEYKDLEAGRYHGAYVCHRCLTELFVESPEAIQSVEKKFP